MPDEIIKEEEVKEEEVVEEPTEAVDVIDDAVEEVVDEVLGFVEIADMITKLDEKFASYFDRISELLLKTGAVTETDGGSEEETYIIDDDVELVPVDELDLSLD